MRRDGLVDYEWQESDAGPPRKYYRLTAKGKSQLTELNEYWKDINTTINQLGRCLALHKVVTINAETTELAEIVGSAASACSALSVVTCSFERHSEATGRS